jgi:hypothetical protein
LVDSECCTLLQLQHLFDHILFLNSSLSKKVQSCQLLTSKLCVGIQYEWDKCCINTDVQGGWIVGKNAVYWTALVRCKGKSIPV